MSSTGRLGRTVERLALSAVLLIVGCGESYDQRQQDRDLLWGFRQLATDIWNAHISGTPTGAKEIGAASPTGGTVRLTGETQADGTHELTYDFTQYVTVVRGTSVTLQLDWLSGQLHRQGNVLGTVAMSATQLALQGELTRDGVGSVSLPATLSFSGSYDANGGQGSVDGRPGSP